MPRLIDLSQEIYQRGGMLRNPLFRFVVTSEMLQEYTVSSRANQTEVNLWSGSSI